MVLKPAVVTMQTIVVGAEDKNERLFARSMKLMNSTEPNRMATQEPTQKGEGFS
jgi:hypothetical protein